MWNRLWFYPGRPTQSAELNEIQTIVLNKLSRLGQTLFTEGSRISGLEIIVKAGNKVQVTNGVMFIDGAPRDITGTPTSPTLQDLQLSGTGHEFISLQRIESTIRPENDISLLNPVLTPTVGITPFNRTGALRQVYTYTWVVVNDANPNQQAIPVFEFRDGNLLTTQSAGQYTAILRVLARRTYDESGHYLVNGFVVNVLPSTTDSTKLILRIDAGKAYVSGYEIMKTIPSVFTIDKATTSAAIIGESFVFHLIPTPIKIYKLASNPVKRITFLAGKVYRSWTTLGNGVRVVRSTTESFDDLFSPTQVSPDLSSTSANAGIAIYQILKIANAQGSPSVPQAPAYAEGVDYELSGNTIQWISGNRPGPSQNYYVDLVLIRAMTPGRRRRQIIVDEPVVHGGANSTDTVAHKDLIRITKIATAAHASNPSYIENRDYLVKTGRTATVVDFGGVDWSPTFGTSLEPSVSQTYYVSYEYWEHLAGQEGDFVARDNYFDTDNVTPAGQYLDNYEYNTWDSGISNSIDFRVVGGDTPIDGLEVNVDYEFYLPRRDTIALSSDGGFIIHIGIPARFPQFPPFSTSSMQIATLDLPANSSNVLIAYPETRRFTEQDIWQVKDMLDVQIYNAAIKSLESLAQFEYTPNYKRMVMVDPFIDFSRAEFTYSVGPVSFSASVNPENGFCGIAELYGTRRLRPFSKQFTSSSFRKTVLGSYTEEDFISQQHATENVPLNPFTILDPVATISLLPSEWFQPDLVSTPDYRPDARIDSLLPLTQNDLRVESTRITRVFGFVRNIINRSWVGASKIVGWGGTSQLNQVTNIFTPQMVFPNFDSNNIVGSRAMDRIDQSLIDRSIVPHLDQISIQVTSTNWRPFADNISVTFDGIPVAMTPSGPGFQGTTLGTLFADANGTWSGSFTIPYKTASGRRQIVASSLVPNTTDTMVSASAVFAGEGLRQIDNTSFVSLIPASTTTTNPNNQLLRTAPIAQVIIGRRNAWLTGVVLFFGKIPTAGSSSDLPLLIQIRDVDQDGVPGPNILSQVSVKSAQIGVAVSLDGSIPFSVTFEDPVYLQEGAEYCLVLDTESVDYNIFLSRLGHVDFITGQQVTKNVDTGSLWRSTGGQSWTLDQYAELKFKIRSAVFNVTQKTVIVFENFTDISSGQTLVNAYREVNVPSVPGSQASLPNRYRKFIHVVSSYSPPGARQLWYYSINAGVSWTQYSPGVEVVMPVVPTQLQIKVEMDMQPTTASSGAALSPASSALNLEHNGLILIGNDIVGSWITKNINFIQAANNLRVSFITDVPLAQTAPLAYLLVYKSTDGGATWTLITGMTESFLSSSLRQWKFDGPVTSYVQVMIRIDLHNAADYSADPTVRSLVVIAY